MRERRSLTPTEELPGQSVVVQTNPAPAFRGKIAVGFDYVCGCCGESVLVENTIEGELCDIVFECFGCKSLGVIPALPLGHPVPKGAMVLQAEEYKTDQPDEIPSGQMLISSREAKRYQAEMGVSPKGSDLVRHEDVLVEIIENIRRALGDTYDEIERGEKQWRAVGSPADYERHPLMHLIDRVRRTSPRHVDTSAITQLFTIQRLYQQFGNHSSWEKIRKQAQDGANFTHDVLTLAFVAQVYEIGGGINILDVLSGRAADIVGSSSPNNLLNIEIKTPKILQRVGRLSAKQASKLMKNSLKSAQSTEGGQLSPGRSGLLVLGAMQFSGESIRILDNAILGEFSRHIEARRHLLGVALVHFKQVSQHVRIRPRPSGLLGGTPPLALDLLSGVGIELTRNPNYTGSFLIDYH